MKKMIAILCAVVLAASAVIGVTNVRSSNKIKGLNADLAAMQDVIEENQKSVDALTEEVAEKTEALTAKEAEIEALTVDVAEKAEQIESLTADVAEKEAQIQTLTADVADKTAQIAALNTAVEAHASEIAALTEQAAAAQTQIDTLAAQSAEKNAQIESLSADLSSAQQKLQLIIDTITGIDSAGDSVQSAPEALPQPGDVIEGFEVKEIRALPLVGAQVVYFEHRQTGAGLTYIANADTNRAFQLSFKTRPLDDTGLPHVFEHACTAGSEKYPSAELWFNLLNQTYNTYFNAHTMDAMTCYPLASLSEAQLLKYADYYTDSCLHPLILREESIFRTEAWRYRMASMEDDLTIEGTVYSEMLNAYSLEFAAMLNANKATFPGAAIGLNYGGTPSAIPDMTWDMLKDYHKSFYHPSNCMVYLYGQFENYTAFLELLNAAFAPYEKAEFQYEDADYTPITEPVETQVPYPAAQGSDPSNRSVAYYYIVCPGMKDSVEQEQIIDNLCALLSHSGSELMNRLQKAFPSAVFSVGREMAAPEDAVVFIAQNINENDGPLFRETVDAALRELAENGFAADMVDSSVAALQLAQKLASESGDPVNGIINSMSYAYAVKNDPFAYLDQLDAVNRMEEMHEQGLYQQAISDWLLDKQTWTLTTTYPEPGLQEAQDAALAEKLAGIKDGMTEEEKQAVIDFTNAPAAKEDASEYVRQLQAVTVESLPEEIRNYEISDTTGEDGVRRINVTAALDGVGRTNLYLDGSGIPQEDILWFAFYGNLLGQLDTEAHTKEELDVLTARYLYNSGIGLAVLNENNAPRLVFHLGWTALDDDLAAGYDLARELVYHTRLDDAGKLLEKVTAEKASARSAINGGAITLALLRGLAADSPYYRLVNYLNGGLDYYQFLDQVEAQLSEAPETVVEKLLAVQESLNNSTNAVLTFVGSQESIDANQPLADAFIAALNQLPITAEAYELPVPAGREAVILDISAQHNLLAAGFDALGLPEYDAGLNVIASLLSDAILVPQLSDQYGVYSPQASAIQDGGFVLVAASDPNVVESFAVFETLADQIAALQIDQETLNGYIMSVYSGLAKEPGELTGGINAMLRALQGEPQDQAITQMRQLKAVTPEAVNASAGLFRSLAEKGARITAGSAAAINANADAFDQILNPFGARDNTQVTLNDVAEGDACYEAVRYVFEHGLMTALAEDSFGAAEIAVTGDWALGVFQLLGGIGTQEEAVETLSQIGLLPPDIKADSPITRTDLTGSCNILCQMAGIGEFDTTLPEGENEYASRGDVAILLMRLDTVE